MKLSGINDRGRLSTRGIPPRNTGRGDQKMSIASTQQPDLPVGGERLQEETRFQRGDQGVNRSGERPSSEDGRKPGGDENHP